MQLDSIKFLLLVFTLTFLVYQVDSTRIQLCGDKLGDALDLFCKAGFNSKIKRLAAKGYDNLDTIENNDNALGFYGAYSDLDFEQQPLLRALLGESAHQLLSNRRRRLGIVEECCRNSCSMEQLLLYCSN